MFTSVAKPNSAQSAAHCYSLNIFSSFALQHSGNHDAMTVNFVSLYQCISHFHGEMNEILHLHQEALLVQDLPLAIRFLRLFKSLIITHIEWEESHLLRLHEELVDEPQWKTLIYREEHNKIRDMLKEVIVRLNQTPVTNNRRWTIEILDYERVFKNVLEHHEEREEKGLLIELDHFLKKPQQDKLITDCHLTLQHSLDNVEEDLQQYIQQLPSTT